MAPTPHPAHTLAAGLLLLAVAAAQNPAPAPAPAPAPIVADPALPERLKELKALVSHPKMADDFQAIGLIQSLVADVAKIAPKDKEKLAKALGDVFRTGKLRPADKDVLYREAGDALGKLGLDGSKELAKAIADPRFKDNLQLLAHWIVALGRTEDEKQVDFLLDTTTRSPHDELRAAAAEALASYQNMDGKLRREVVKQVVREWGSLHQQATTPDPVDASQPIPLQPQNARRTLKAVEGKWVAALQKLTGQTHGAFADWQRWLNKNPNWTPPGQKK